MRLAIISLNSDSSKMIGSAAKEFFSQVDMLDIRKFQTSGDSKNLRVLYESRELGDYDCIYIRGSYKYSVLSRSITLALNNKIYMPVTSDAFTVGHDKFLTLLNLQRCNVPIPKTHLAANTKVAKKILEEIHYPAILKIPAGTHGKGVMFADSLSSAKTLLDALETFKQPYIIQEYVESNASDIRAIVVNNKVVAAMKRKAGKSELRANIHAGAIGQKLILDYDTAQLAVKSAKAIGADICAVDLLQGIKTSVIEVNLSPGLQGITNASKVNVAKEIAKGLYENTKLFLEKKKSKDYEDTLKELDIKNGKEVLLNLDIKAGRIRLPESITKICGFSPEEEVVLLMDKGKVILKKIRK